MNVLGNKYSCIFIIPIEKVGTVIHLPVTFDGSVDGKSPHAPILVL